MPLYRGTYHDLIHENLQKWLLSPIFLMEHIYCNGSIIKFLKLLIKSPTDTGDSIIISRSGTIFQNRKQMSQRL